MLEALFKPKPSPRMTPEAMAAHLADLREKGVALQASYDEAALAAADGLADQASADAAHAALWKNKQAIERTADVLAAIDRRETAAQVAQAAKAKDDAWAATAEHAKRRVTIAARLAASLKAAGEEYAAFIACTTQMQRAFPLGYPTHSKSSFGIAPTYVADLVRVEYARNGLPGGPALEGKTPTTLEQRCRENVERLGEARARSMGASANG